ncbi:hypothetical protein BJ917_4643 [Pseudomonas sp. WPR_5_2]|nr:hypothetical protein BJ917_4643 [Pseudomonas sp. WPR_5_2]
MNTHVSEVQNASIVEESWPRDFDIRACRAEQQEILNCSNNRIDSRSDHSTRILNTLTDKARAVQLRN